MEKTKGQNVIRTGLYGGSFNPVHNGHVKLAQRMLKAAHLDEVWLLVTPQNPWKSQTDLLDDDIRFRMAREAVADIPGVVASNYEFHLPKPSYTWDTLQALAKDYPDRQFTLLIGGDNWERFNGWYQHDKILANYDIAVFPRRGTVIDKDTLPPRVRVLRAALIDISGTDIRRRIREGQPFDHLVPPQVARIIQEEHLYTEQGPE